MKYIEVVLFCTINLIYTSGRVKESSHLPFF